ncbi:9180_t:CDS:2 [Ambispora leptoticha]|uniref:9180_t:CDS:1 n=1 Tax=Ambispora leptoticha TaxID=144679 RepID=A0A9N9A0I7_9GLOM|nr:9180_t:CDS:2 [Ambispora leptoticha]
MVKAQKYLDEKYPKEERENITELDISNKHLEELNLKNNSKLTQLDIANNNFSRQDLSFLGHLTNLELLLIGNDNNKTGGVRNRFYGSLKPLQSMENLKFYNYDNTDVERDIDDEDIPPAELGKLPENSKKLAFSGSMRLDPQLGNWVSSVIHAKGSLSFGELPDLLKNSPQTAFFSKNEKKIYDSIKKEIRKKIKARELLKEELEKKDDKINLINAQRDINYHYPTKEEREKETKLDISDKNLEVNLEELNLSNNKFTGSLEPLKDLKNFDYKTELRPNCKLASVKAELENFLTSKQNKNIILKSLNNSRKITPEFLREIASHKLFGNQTKIVKCHGISQDPQGNYIMVMDYVRGEGLKNIHEKGLVHKDFHSGNILSGGSETFFTDLPCHITDLGLCRPASEKEQEYNQFSQNTPYQTHPTAITHSKSINTQQITQLLQKIKPTSNLEAILEFELPETSYSLEDDFGLAELNLAEETEETTSQIEIPPKNN